MIQPKYSPEEALERIKLMMKYDTSKTLNENVKSIKQPINEFIVPIPFLTNAAAAAAIGTWLYNVQGGGDSFAKTRIFFEGCSTNMNELKPTVSKEEYRAAADSIYNALAGVGTDEDAIKSALKSMPTVADLCALHSYYTRQYGDLYDDLDSDIDGSDFLTYVWSAIAPQVADAEDEVKAAEEGETPDEDGDDEGDNRGGGYRDCSGTYSYGCKSSVIAKVQGCLGGLVTDGKFGPKTQAALTAKGFSSFTDADVDKICNTTTNPSVDPDEEDVDGVDPNNY